MTTYDKATPEGWREEARRLVEGEQLLTLEPWLTARVAGRIRQRVADLLARAVAEERERNATIAMGRCVNCGEGTTYCHDWTAAAIREGQR